MLRKWQFSHFGYSVLNELPLALRVKTEVEKLSSLFYKIEESFSNGGSSPYRLLGSPLIPIGLEAVTYGQSLTSWDKISRMSPHFGYGRWLHFFLVRG